MARTPARPGTWPLVVLSVWTLYVWSTRISNALGDQALSTGAKTFSVVLSLTFVAFALGGIAIVVRSWSRPRARGEVRIIQAFAVWTVVVWAVRIPMILADDHEVGFKVVHAVLGLISIGLAVWAYRSATATGAAEESLPSVARG